MANRPPEAADRGPHTLWFSPPDGDDRHRRALTRERVVAEALAIIGAGGVDALSMRALAARLGVVPGALYRHVRSKGQLCDLVADSVLAEVDCRPGGSPGWTEQVKALADRLRTVLENHPGIAGLLKTRDPLGPHSLALAEAFLAPCSKPACPAGRPPWPSASSTTTPWASRSATAPPSTSSASRTPRPGASCTRSSGHCQPTGSRRWPPWASTSGPTTATNGSPPAWTPSSAACSPRRPGPAGNPQPDQHQATTRHRAARSSPGPRICSPRQPAREPGSAQPARRRRLGQDAAYFSAAFGIRITPRPRRPGRASRDPAHRVPDLARHWDRIYSPPSQAGESFSRPCAPCPRTWRSRRPDQ